MKEFAAYAMDVVIIIMICYGLTKGFQQLKNGSKHNGNL